MDKVLEDIIQEMDTLLKDQNEATGVSDGAGSSVTYTLNGKSVRIEASKGTVVLFEVLAPGTEFPYRTWQNQTQIAAVAKAALDLLNGEN